MGIQKRLFYVMSCDECLCMLGENENLSLSSIADEDKKIIIKIAEKHYRWKNIEGKWLCPNCQEED